MTKSKIQLVKKGAEMAATNFTQNTARVASQEVSCVFGVRTAYAMDFIAYPRPKVGTMSSQPFTPDGRRRRCWWSMTLLALCSHIA